MNKKFKKSALYIVCFILGIVTYQHFIKPLSHSTRASQQKETDKAFKTLPSSLPDGRHVTGILLSDLYVPIGSFSCPVLIGLTDPTMILDKQQSNLKSCFVIGEGYADLVLERVFIELKTLHCVTMDSTSFRKKITGYVLDENKQMGLKGQVVLSQANLLFTKLLEGVPPSERNIIIARLQEQRQRNMPSRTVAAAIKISAGKTITVVFTESNAFAKH